MDRHGHLREIQRQARELAGAAYLDGDPGPRLQHALRELPQADRTIFASVYLARLGLLEQSIAMQRRRQEPPRGAFVGRRETAEDAHGDE